MNRGLGLFLGGAITATIVLGIPLFVWASNASPRLVTQRISSSQVTDYQATDSSSWELRSEHFKFGMPRLIDSRYGTVSEGSSPEGISVLVREGFVVGYANRFKAPLWVSVHWTRDLFEESERLSDSERDFKADSELSENAQGNTRYGNSSYERGHMARNKDNLAWGLDNTEMGDRMSNIVPQTRNLNGRVWARLEDAHRKVVASGKMDEIWVISGAVYEKLQTIDTVGNGIGVPAATYKVIAWFDSRKRFHAQGFIVPQTATDIESERYLVPIRLIEEKVGIDFFPKLPVEESERIETATSRVLWE